MPLWWWAGPPAFRSSTPPLECSPPMLAKASIWGYYCFLINLSTILILSLHLQHYVDQVFATLVRQEIRHILTRAPRWWCHHLLPPAQVAADAPSLYSPPHSSAFYKPLSASHLQGKEIHTLTRPKQSTSRGKRFLAAFLDSFASPTLAHPSQRRKASPD